jgi:hypothetical protein
MTVWAALVLLGPAPGCASSRGIMSWGEYSRTEHSVPYVIEFARGEGALVYFGAQHIGEGVGLSTHPEVAEIEREWERLRPTRAFYEGRSTYGATLSSVSEAAAKAGEGGVLRFLAARDGVDAQSLEPTGAEEVRALRTRFSLEQIRVFYVLRCVSQNCTGAGSPGDQARRWFERTGGRPELAGAPDTIEGLDRSARRLLSRLGDWRTVTRASLDPKPEAGETFLNEISRRSNDVRDSHMVGALVAAVRDGQRVFAVVGASHVVMQERALRTALKR